MILIESHCMARIPCEKGIIISCEWQNLFSLSRQLERRHYSEKLSAVQTVSMVHASYVCNLIVTQKWIFYHYSLFYHILTKYIFCHTVYSYQGLQTAKKKKETDKLGMHNTSVTLLVIAWFRDLRYCIFAFSFSHLDYVSLKVHL